MMDDRKRSKSAKPTQTDIPHFDRTKLKHVCTKVQMSLPTQADIYEELLPDDLTKKAEIKEIKTFIKSSLKHADSIEHPYVPDVATILEEKRLSRSEVKTFDKSTLKSVETKETKMVPTPQDLREELLPDVLPTRPELHALQQFVRSYLKHVETTEKNPLPSIDDILAEEKATMGEIKKFDRNRLRHSYSVEKNTLPTYATIWDEFLPDELPSRPELKELVKFAHTDLHHVTPNVKVCMPTQQVIEDEKAQSRCEVKQFDKHTLRRVNTEEHNPLPTEADLWEELLPDYLPPKPELDALKHFVKSSLKHVQTIEKHYKPTAQGKKWHHIRFT